MHQEREEAFNDNHQGEGEICCPPPRTKWTRRVPRPVLIGHAASLSQVTNDNHQGEGKIC